MRRAASLIPTYEHFYVADTSWEVGKTEYQVLRLRPPKTEFYFVKTKRQMWCHHQSAPTYVFSGQLRTSFYHEPKAAADVLKLERKLVNAYLVNQTDGQIKDMFRVYSARTGLKASYTAARYREALRVKGFSYKESSLYAPIRFWPFIDSNLNRLSGDLNIESFRCKDAELKTFTQKVVDLIRNDQPVIICAWSYSLSPPISFQDLPPEFRVDDGCITYHPVPYKKPVGHAFVIVGVRVNQVGKAYFYLQDGLLLDKTPLLSAENFEGHIHRLEDDDLWSIIWHDKTLPNKSVRADDANRLLRKA